MKKTLILLSLLFSIVVARAQSDVWRYDASSGTWFIVEDSLYDYSGGHDKKKDIGISDVRSKNHYSPKDYDGDKRSKNYEERYERRYQKNKYNVRVSDFRIEKTNEWMHNGSLVKPWNVYGLVRTNLLGDAVLVPNLGGEITIGKDWSLGADFYLQWIRNLEKDKFYKTYILDVDARYWWGQQHRKRQLSGWHVGPYGQAITWDMENGHRGTQSRVFFWTFAVGGELGYNLPLGKKQRWGLDFNIGVGYLHTKYNVYNPGHNKQYFFDHRQCKNFFGPTKIGVSLNYFIK